LAETTAALLSNAHANLARRGRDISHPAVSHNKAGLNESRSKDLASDGEKKEGKVTVD
jgi:hypothetical protein